MIDRSLDYSLPHKFYEYGRMSDLKRQNPRSPDQQFATIQETLKRHNYTHWQRIRSYRDDGKSARSEAGRSGFKQMIADAISARDGVSLILVDTKNRFSRADNLPELRRWLHDQYGIVILSADKNFADPTTSQGRLHGVVEDYQASEDGRQKAHMVLRGKLDVIRQKRWAGGEPPFGLRLQKMIEQRGSIDHVYSILVPDPETAWIVRLVFEQALKTGWGRKRLADFLRLHPDVPPEHWKLPATIGDWLTNELYAGVMIWPKVHTDIIDDIRVLQPAPVADQVRIEDYCEAIVPPDVFWSVYELVHARGAALIDARKRKAAAEGNNKSLIPAVASGMTLKYPLSGLVRCALCKHPMRPSRSSVYTTASGEERVYELYTCPKHAEGLCPNATGIPIDWLWAQVVESLRQRLFPGFWLD